MEKNVMYFSEISFFVLLYKKSLSIWEKVLQDI